MVYGFNKKAHNDDTFLTNYFSKAFNDVLLERKNDSSNERVEFIKKVLIDVANNPPEFEIGRYWAYPMIAGLIATVSKTNHIWSTLTKDIIAKLDLIMELFLYTEAHATNQKSRYTTGFHGLGGWSKDWAPNHRFPTYSTMFYVIDYFGGIDNVNAKLAAFNFEEVITKIRLYGFERCAKLWSAEDIDLGDGLYTRSVRYRLEEGGKTYIQDRNENVYSGGYGAPIYEPYKISKKEEVAKDILISLLSFCYDKVCVSEILISEEEGLVAKTLDGSISPVNGQMGMMHEFHSPGGAGPGREFRSSLFFCTWDFVLATSLLAYATEFTPELLEAEDALLECIAVGNTDLLHKVDHGYIGNANGHTEVTQAGALYDRFIDLAGWKNYWLEYLNK